MRASEVENWGFYGTIEFESGSDRANVSGFQLEWETNGFDRIMIWTLGMV